MAKEVKFKVDRPKKSEVRRMARIIMDALVVPPERQKHLMELFQLLGQENLRAVRAGGEVVGGLGIIPMGHFFGGKRVGCGGITLVGVSPEWRGKGAASTLVGQTVRELHKAGYALSALFAATNTLYRKSGYERAIVKHVYEVETNAIETADRECEMVFARKGATRQFKDTYLKRAMHTNGNLDRHHSLWEWLHNPRGYAPFRYMVKRKGKVEGYVVYIQKRGEKESSIYITDVCILSAAAGRRILTFFAGHGTMVKKIAWGGGPNDPMLALLGEEKYKIAHTLHAMVRMVSVPLALKARGYPARVETEVHFHVEDDLIPSNSGDFVLTVSGGRGKVKKGGGGSVRLDIRALAQLFTGKCSPRELALLGKLDAPERELDRLAPVFAGPAPWLPDEF